jgi:hypothetical protein
MAAVTLRSFPHLQIEEDMVLASEPASPGAGVRLETVVAMRASDNELLTDSEHRL